MAVRHALASGLPQCVHGQMYPYTDPLVSPEHLEAIANITKDRCQIYSIEIPPGALIDHYGDYVIFTSLDPVNEKVQKVALYSLRHRTMLWTKEMPLNHPLTDPTACQVSDHGMVLAAPRGLINGSYIDDVRDMNFDVLQERAVPFDIDNVQDTDRCTISIMVDGRQIGSLPRYLWISVIPKERYILTKRIDEETQLPVLEIWDPSLREPCFRGYLVLQGLAHDGFLIHSDDFMVHLSENGGGAVRIDAVDLRMITGVTLERHDTITQIMPLTRPSSLSSACIMGDALIISCCDSNETRSIIYIYDLDEQNLVNFIDIETDGAMLSMTANRHFLVWKEDKNIKYLKFSDKEVKIIATTETTLAIPDSCSLQLSENILSVVYEVNDSRLCKKIMDLSLGICLSSAAYVNRDTSCSLSNHRLVMVTANDNYVYVEDYATSAVESSNTSAIALRIQ